MSTLPIANGTAIPDERMFEGQGPLPQPKRGLQPAHMLRSFGDRETGRFFESRRVAAFQSFAQPAARPLILVDSTDTLGDLAAPPSNRLEALRGDRAGQHGIRINAQWRVSFRRTNDGPHDVEIVDFR